MSAPKLATTTFEAGPDDKLAVVDVYAESSGGIVNSYQETHDESIDVLDSLNGKAGDTTGDATDALGGSIGDNVGDAIGSGLGGSNNDLSDLIGGLDGAPDIGSIGDLESLTNGDSDLLSSISDLAAPLSDSLSQIGQGFDDISVIENGVVVGSIAPGFDLKSVRGINDVVTKLSDGNYNGIINHAGGLSNLVSNVCNVGSRIGIPNVFSNITKGINDIELMTKSLTNIVPNIIKTANIPLLNDIARTPLASVVKRIAPNVISNTIANITKPINMAVSDIGKFYSQARSTFSKIDADWNKVSFGANKILNATVVSQNPFMKQAMMTDICARPAVVIPNEMGEVVNASDTYYDDDPGNSLIEAGYSGSVYEGDHTPTPDEEAISYNQRTEDRFTDSFIAAALSFDREKVGDAIETEFTEVGATAGGDMFF